MPVKDVDIGARGHLRCQVDLVSQDLEDNESRVRVRGFIWLDSGSSSSDNTGNCKAWITGTNSAPKQTANFSVSGTTKVEIIDKTFTVPHNADGSKTGKWKVNFGPTITSNFGNGGSAEVTWTLPPLPRSPNAMPAPTLTFIAPNSIKVAFISPPGSSLPIDSYNIRYANNPEFTGAVVVNAGLALDKTISGLAKNTTWYFAGRAHNEQGWGVWGPASNYSIPNTPGQVQTYSLTAVAANKVRVTITPPATGGSPITGYDILFADNSGWVSPTLVETTSTVKDVIVPGGILYFRVRAKNAIGVGGYSGTQNITIVVNPKILIGGTWRNTEVYVRHQGVWKLAIAYVRKGGVWSTLNV